MPAIAMPPVRNLAIAAGIGVGVSAFFDVVTPGRTPRPTVGGTVSNVVGNVVVCGALNAGIAMLQKGNWKAAAVQGAFFGAAFAIGSAGGNFGSNIAHV